MVRFSCSCCKKEFWDKRFFWEAEEGEGRVGTESHKEGEDMPCGGITETCHLYRAVGSAPMDAGLMRCLPKSDESSLSKDASAKHDGVDDVRILAPDCVDASASLARGQKEYMRFLTPDSDYVDEQKEEQNTDLKFLAPYADALRATGTTSNIVGSLAPCMSAVCSPVSAVAGIAGVSGGVMQLHQGLCTPSGRVDDHLVTKGSVVTTVGATCMVLGMAAFAYPALFVVSLGLGVAGLGTATMVDVSMAGLCPECRANPQPVATSSQADSCDQWLGG